MIGYEFIHFLFQKMNNHIQKSIIRMDYMITLKDNLKVHDVVNLQYSDGTSEDVLIHYNASMDGYADAMSEMYAGLYRKNER